MIQLADGTTICLRDWLLPWRALRIIRFYAGAVAQTNQDITRLQNLEANRNRYHKDYVLGLQHAGFYLLVNSGRTTKE